MSQKAVITPLPSEKIKSKILIIRDQKVMLDADLAGLYGVATKRLNEQVKRNQNRFPDSFMFQLNKQEFVDLRSQIATTKWSKRRIPPYAFTEYGVLQAANVLNSEVAITMSVQIIETFVQLRQMIVSHEDLIRRIDVLESQYDKQFKQIFDLVRNLINPTTSDQKKRKIGFLRDNED